MKTVIASEASNPYRRNVNMDRFVASLLAMTDKSYADAGAP
jgi:hypothetical protein